MRLSIIAILISLSAIGYGQDTIPWNGDGDTLVLQDAYYYWPIPIRSDTIKDGERIELRAGNGISLQPVGYISTYEPWNKPYSSSVAELLHLYEHYLLERPTVTRHETDIGDDILLEDCELKSITHRSDGNMWFQTVCVKPEHQKQFPVSASFEGFIKWLKEQ